MPLISEVVPYKKSIEKRKLARRGMNLKLDAGCRVRETFVARLCNEVQKW